MRALGRPLALSLAAALLLGASPAARAEGPAASGSGVAFEPGTPPFEEVLSKAKAQGKPVFLDFATDWCGWCKRLDRDVFSRDDVAEAMKGYVAVHVDAEKGEGPSLAKRYGVSGFPTLVVVDAAGDEVDRVVGYLPADKFLVEAKRILAGEGTIPALSKRWKDASDLEAGIALGRKLAASRPADAADHFQAVVAKAESADRPTQARVRLEQAAALHAAKRSDEAVKVAEALVRDYADSPAAAEAAARVGRAFLEADTRRALTFFEAARALAKEPAEKDRVEALTVEALRRATAEALRRRAKAAADDPMRLNAVAWDAFESKLAMREAVVWARRAVEGSKRDPMVLGTLANLLFVQGARDEAIELETEAVGKAEGPLAKELSVVLARMEAERDAALAAKEAAGEASPPAPAPAPAPAPKAPAPAGGGAR